MQKVKLWCILHGVDINNAVDMNCQKGICPHWQDMEEEEGDGCNLEWANKLAVNEELTKVGKEPYELNKLPFCIEWVGHV